MEGSGREPGGLVPGGGPAGDGAQGACVELRLPEGSEEKQEVSTPHTPYCMYNTIIHIYSILHIKRVCQGVLPCGVLLPQVVCEEV